MNKIIIIGIVKKVLLILALYLFTDCNKECQVYRGLNDKPKNCGPSAKQLRKAIEIR